MSRSHWGWLPFSVALNLVLIGAILGWAARPHEPAPRQALVTWQRELLPSLPAADVPVVSGATERIAATQSQADATVHQAYMRIRTMLAASSLDKPGLQTAFEAIRSARDAQQTTIDGIFFEELSTLTPAGRAIVLKAMEAESHRFHPPGGH
jgi:hypothetical protein